MSSGATGFPLTNKLPASVAQIQFGASASGGGGAPRYILIMANGTSAGTAVLDTTAYDLFQPDDALTLAGTGSEAHIAAQATFKKYPNAKVKLIVTTSATGAVATATLTVAGVPTGSGNFTIYIHGVGVVVGIIAGQSVTQIA